MLPILLLLALAPAPEAPAEYRQQIEKWQADRVRRLKEPDGWLSVVGLSWLEQGENPVGSDPKARVVLPAGKAPARLGTIQLSKDGATFSAAPGARVTHDGKPVRTIALAPDAAGDPTIVQHGTLSFYLIQRGERLGVRVKDSASPAFRVFSGLQTYPIRPEWRIRARFARYDPKKIVPIPNIVGTVSKEPSPGAVVFRAGGRELRLDAIEEEGSDELFLIFGDATNGKETYGAGRFLYAPKPGKDGTTIVDFNKAYNPPCAFTAYATCPLPPPQNRLPIRVEAGEKKYGDH